MRTKYGFGLSSAELVKELATGEWVISGGRELYNRIYTGSGVRLPIAKFEVRDGLLCIRPDGHDVEIQVSTENVFLARKYRNEMIEVRQPYMTRCQRSKADGGGEHEIFVLMPALQLVNKKREDERLQQEEERHRVEAERWARQHEEHERKKTEARARFVAGLNEYVGKKVSKITASDQGDWMCLEFDDGTKLEIVSQDQEEYCSWLIVNDFPLVP